MKILPLPCGQQQQCVVQGGISQSAPPNAALIRRERASSAWAAEVSTTSQAVILAG